MGECCPRWNALLYRTLFTPPSFKRNASAFFLKRLYGVSRTGASPSWFLPNVCLVLAVLFFLFFPFDTCESAPQPLLAPWILFICLFIYLFFCSFFPDMTLAHFFWSCPWKGNVWRWKPARVSIFDVLYSMMKKGGAGGTDSGSQTSACLFGPPVFPCSVS